MNFRTLVSGFTAISMLFAQVLIPAHAAVVQTEQYLQVQDRAALIATFDATLAREDVRHALVAHGVDPDAARARVASLSDAELTQIVGQLETLPAGGDSALVVIGIVFLVLLILEVTGIIDIFKKP